MFGIDRCRVIATFCVDSWPHGAVELGGAKISGAVNAANRVTLTACLALAAPHSPSFPLRCSLAPSSRLPYYPSLARARNPAKSTAIASKALASMARVDANAPIPNAIVNPDSSVCPDNAFQIRVPAETDPVAMAQAAKRPAHRRAAGKSRVARRHRAAAMHRAAHRRAVRRAAEAAPKANWIYAVPIPNVVRHCCVAICGKAVRRVVRALV